MKQNHTRKPFLNWTDRMVGTHICTKQELLRWLMALLFFIEAQSDTLGPLLRVFCLDPGMPHVAYLVLHAQIPSWEHSGNKGNWQLLLSPQFPLRC